MEDGITYLCMAEESFGRRIPFAFLEDVKNRFKVTYGARAKTAVAFTMQADFAKTLQNLTVWTFWTAYIQTLFITCYLSFRNITPTHKIQTRSQSLRANLMRSRTSWLLILVRTTCSETRSRSNFILLHREGFGARGKNRVVGRQDWPIEPNFGQLQKEGYSIKAFNVVEERQVDNYDHFDSHRMYCRYLCCTLSNMRFRSLSILLWLFLAEDCCSKAALAPVRWNQTKFPKTEVLTCILLILDNTPSDPNTPSSVPAATPTAAAASGFLLPFFRNALN